MSEWDEYTRYVNQDGVEVTPVSYPRGYYLLAFMSCYLSGFAPWVIFLVHKGSGILLLLSTGVSCQIYVDICNDWNAIGPSFWYGLYLWWDFLLLIMVCRVSSQLLFRSNICVVCLPLISCIENVNILYLILLCLYICVTSMDIRINYTNWSLNFTGSIWRCLWIWVCSLWRVLSS